LREDLLICMDVKKSHIEDRVDNFLRPEGRILARNIVYLHVYSRLEKTRTINDPETSLDNICDKVRELISIAVSDHILKRALVYEIGAA